MKYQVSEKAPRAWLQFEAIWIAVILLLCLAGLAVSYIVPKINFDTAVVGTNVVVKRAPEDEVIHQGDIIEAIDGQTISTRAELYYQLARHPEQVEATIKRNGARFVRPVTAASLANDTLPVGLTPEDRPIAISFGGDYSTLEGYEISQLHNLLIENRAENASVVFRRPTEQTNVLLNFKPAIGRTLILSATLLLIIVMGFVALRMRQNVMKGVYINTVLGLTVLAAMWTILGATLLCMPILFLFGMIAMGMLKSFDLNYHIWDTNKLQKPNLCLRTVLYLIPAVCLLAPIVMCLKELPMIWGGSNDALSEIRLDALSIIPVLLVIGMTMIDAGRSAYRAYSGRRLQPRDFALFIAFVLALTSLVIMWSDFATARIILVATLIAQATGDAMECFTKRALQKDVSYDDDIFAADPIREALEEAETILNHAWVVQAIIDRPEPRHVVAIAASDDTDEDVNGLALHVLSNTWRDFLDIYRVEGMIEGGDSPACDIANRLGIVFAQPIAEKVGGSLTSITLLVSTREMPDANAPQNASPSVSQRAALSKIAEKLAENALALVYHSTEMSLEYIGDDLDEIANRIHNTASFPRALHNPTIPLLATEIPHGLLEEDDVQQADDDVVEIQDPEQNIDDYSTKVFQEEVNLLRSQVHTLCSQQIRAFALAEIEFTEDQKAALEDLRSLETPIVLIGERGVGKTILTLSAHQERCEGPFLQIDAGEIPETILALDMFGDSEHPGLIKSAVGGSLLIKNVDKLSTPIISDIMEAIDAVAAEGTIDLYMTIAIRDDEVITSKFDRHPNLLPERCREIIDHCDAETVFLKPLREQEDILDAAMFFMQRQSMRSDKNIMSIETNAQAALSTYRWPGNFSELRSVIERAVMRAEGDALTVHDLGADFASLINADTKNTSLDQIYYEQIEQLQTLNEKQLAQIDRLNERIKTLESSQDTPQDDFTVGTFDEIEKAMLVRILNRYHNDPEVAVEALATNKTKFFNKLRKYGLYS